MSAKPLQTKASSISPARLIAFRTLRRLARGSAAEVIDTDTPTTQPGHTRDAALARAIFMTVAKNEVMLDAQLARHLDRPGARLPEAARIILRMVAAQRFFLDRLPEHSIVDEAVKLARGPARLAPSVAGLVNAVSRRIVAQPAPVAPTFHSEVEELAWRYSMPAPLLNRITAQFGARAREVLDAIQAAPIVTLRVNRRAGTRPEIAARLEADGIGSAATAFSPDGLTLNNPRDLGEVLAHPLFHQGALYVQDEASQLVALVAEAYAGSRILDLCAAPGGKCTHLAELLGDKARITATDESETRLAVLKDNLARLQTDAIEVVELHRAANSGPFDLVLLDAPCSGTGTLRRHPEVRHRFSEDGLNSLASRQARLLGHALTRLVQPGGVVVYSTCSFLDEENGRIAAHAVADGIGTPVDLCERAPASVQPLIGADGALRSWPGALQMDGFQVHAIRSLPGTPK